MLKVIHSVSTWLPQTETWLYNQVKYLPSDVESHILCERTENLEQFALPNIHALEDGPVCRYFWDKGLRKLRLRRHLYSLVQEVKEIRADMLHSHFGNVGWTNIGVAKRSGLKHMVTFYGMDVNRLPSMDPRWHKRYQDLFSHVDKVLCEGPFMAQNIKKLGCSEEKVTVHHLGVEVDKISFKPRIWHSGEPLKALIAGSFREKKGIPYALEALGVLHQEVPIEITIIGDATKEPRSIAEKEKIKATIEKHQLKSKVRMLGYQPHSIFFKEAYNHHIFISPSVTSGDGDTEGGAPVSIIEIIATGMPVITTRHCDIPGLFPESFQEFLAEERDVEGLVNLFKLYIEMQGDWEPMLVAGRNYVEKEFNCTTQVVKLINIYRGL